MGAGRSMLEGACICFVPTHEHVKFNGTTRYSCVNQLLDLSCCRRLCYHIPGVDPDDVKHRVETTEASFSTRGLYHGYHGDTIVHKVFYLGN